MTVFKFQKYSQSNISPLVHFNVKNCVGEIGKIVKNEIFASTSTVLSYLGGEMIKVSGLGTYMG